MVAGFAGPNDPLPVAPGLPPPPPDTQYLAGTIVASSIGALPDVSKPPPPDVPTPQGLEVCFAGGKVANSVRGVLVDGGYLYVADEVANAVKVYDPYTGDLHAQIAGDNLSAPVQLLLEDTTLYIGSSGNDSVISYDLEQGFPKPVVAPATFIPGAVKHVSGMAFDSHGHFFAAERTAKTIKRFPATGGPNAKHFITTDQGQGARAPGARSIPASRLESAEGMNVTFGYL